MKEYVSPELEIIDIAGDVITASGACEKDLPICADAIKCEKCICPDEICADAEVKCTMQ